MKQRWYRIDWETPVDDEIHYCDGYPDTAAYMKCTGAASFVQFPTKISLTLARKRVPGATVSPVTKGWVDTIDGCHEHGTVIYGSKQVVSKIVYHTFFTEDPETAIAFDARAYDTGEDGGRGWLVHLQPDSDIDMCTTFGAVGKWARCAEQLAYVYLDKYATRETVRRWFASPETIAIVPCRRSRVEALFAGRDAHVHYRSK